MSDIIIDLTNLTINTNMISDVTSTIGKEYETKDIKLNSEKNKSIVLVKKQNSHGNITKHKHRNVSLQLNTNSKKLENKYNKLREKISDLQLQLAHYKDIIEHKNAIIIDQRKIIQRQSDEIFSRVDELAMLEETVALLRSNPYANISSD